jgi:hypothetical protein
MSLGVLDHELITLITGYMPVRDVARLAMVCKLTYKGACNNFQYAHMHKYKHVINDIKNIKYSIDDDLMTDIFISSLPYKCRISDICYFKGTRQNVNDMYLFCMGPVGCKYIRDPDLNNKIIID